MVSYKTQIKTVSETTALYRALRRRDIINDQRNARRQWRRDLADRLESAWDERCQRLGDFVLGIFGRRRKRSSPTVTHHPPRSRSERHALPFPARQPDFSMAEN
ncbi:MAG: hypothetical protein KDM91_07240 [Verrucomicrobiae bacterium]|nr:hypothetical protein [Verrucomicrobiae bacterium]MCP5539575.1 hypothetical protein [Akkermansiaceae bacterium]MCP5550025.1 hypothetical protein [Akkermansiaceae bacterium]